MDQLNHVHISTYSGRYHDRKVAVPGNNHGVTGDKFAIFCVSINFFANGSVRKCYVNQVMWSKALLLSSTFLFTSSLVWVEKNLNSLTNVQYCGRVTPARALVLLGLFMQPCFKNWLERMLSLDVEVIGTAQQFRCWGDTWFSFPFEVECLKYSCTVFYSKNVVSNMCIELPCGYSSQTLAKIIAYSTFVSAFISFILWFYWI